jgi:hypothetical protein
MQESKEIEIFFNLNFALFYKYVERNIFGNSFLKQ